MAIFKVRIFYDNSNTLKSGESVYLIQGDDIYNMKDKFITNSWTLHEEFDIEELRDLNFNLVWDIRDGYGFVGYRNDHGVVIAINEVTFTSYDHILYMGGNEHYKEEAF